MRRWAREDDAVELRWLRAAEAGAADLAWCDALLLATPENFGFMSGGMKDSSTARLRGTAQQLNRAFALIISAGNDGSGAVPLHRILRVNPCQVASRRSCAASPTRISNAPPIPGARWQRAGARHF
jgi:hypothetical protein